MVLFMLYAQVTCIYYRIRRFFQKFKIQKFKNYSKFSFILRCRRVFGDAGDAEMFFAAVYSCVRCQSSGEEMQISVIFPDFGDLPPIFFWRGKSNREVWVTKKSSKDGSTAGHLNRYRHPYFIHVKWYLSSDTFSTKRSLRSPNFVLT